MVSQINMESNSVPSRSKIAPSASRFHHPFGQGARSSLQVPVMSSAEKIAETSATPSTPLPPGWRGCPLRCRRWPRQGWKQLQMAFQGVKGDGVGIFFGSGGKDRADPQVVRTVLLRLDCLVHRLSRDAQDHQLPARRRMSRATLSCCPHVNAVCTALEGYSYIVIDDQGDLIGVAERLQFQSLCEKRFVVQLLFPQLDTGCAAWRARSTCSYRGLGRSRPGP